MIELRPYQQAAINAVYEHLRQLDDNPCVVIPTAGGKTPIMASICKDAIGIWNGRVLILAHVKELLEQSADKLRVVCPEVDFGIYSAGLKRRDTQHPVIVAGIQSVYKRAYELGAFNLVMVDEAHLIPLEGDGMYRQFLVDAKMINPELRIIGFTATPFRLKTGSICTPDGLLNHICYEIGVRELICDGFLCPLVSKAGKAKADTAGLYIRAGEFVADEVETLMDQESLVRSACTEIVEHTASRNACLVFASGVQHGQHIVEILRREHGIECGFVCGETPTPRRDAMLARFKAGNLKYLCNVNVLTTGFDAPHIDCVALLRPTMSAGLYSQMCLDMETEVLTKSGWRCCHDVTTGDLVATFDLVTEDIVYVPAIDKVHRRLKPGESMYGITAPHLNLRVTDQHTMVVRGRAKTCKHWQQQTAQDVSKRSEMFTIPVAGRGSNHQADADVSDAEVAFIGWFLTDGYRNHLNGTVSISQSTAKFSAEIRDVLTRCGFAFREYAQVRSGKEFGYADGIQFVIPHGAGRGTNGGRRGWRHLKDWLNKEVPAIFDTLSRRQFAILLEAMNLGNGRHDQNLGYHRRVMEISVGCRQRMANRIQQLAIERGYRCNSSEINPQPNAWNQHPQTQWMLRVKSQQWACVGGTRQDSSRLMSQRCQLVPVDFRRNEWVWCLTTMQGTLVTRRDGKVAIVGNCGRGFRLHPGKENCLVLDFGGNVVRHGPVDQVKITTLDRGDGQAHAKECPGCQTLIATGFSRCPQCDFVFPSRDRKQHDAKASEAGILSGQVTTTKFCVKDVLYRVHTKRGASEDAPKTLRVDYQVGWHDYKSEWVCFEHEGYARHKAVVWWQRRSPDPVPDSAERAIEIIEGGGLALTLGITVGTVAGDPCERIIDYELGPMPEPIPPNELLDYSPDEIPF